MDFQLTYSGAPGSVIATLRESGTIVGEAIELKDGRAARRWARRAARDHRVENTPDATESEELFINGTQTFTL